jgi:hypothetical protein
VKRMRSLVPVLLFLALACDDPSPGLPPTPALQRPARKAAQNYQQVDLSDAGRIVGAVSYNGSQKDRRLHIDKDMRACCAKCTNKERWAQSGEVNLSIVFSDES